MDAQECTEKPSETNVRSFCWSKRQNVNNAQLKSHKAHKHSCFKKNRGHTQTHPTHMLSQGLLSQKLCMANLSRGKGMCFVFVCVPSWTECLLWHKAQLSQLKIQCHLLLQKTGLFVPSHLDQHRDSSVAPNRTMLPFLSISYIPTHFLSNLRHRVTFNEGFFLHFSVSMCGFSFTYI